MNNTRYPMKEFLCFIEERTKTAEEGLTLVNVCEEYAGKGYEANATEVLSKMCVCSVIRKAESASGNKYLHKLLSDMLKGIYSIENAETALNGEYEEHFNMQTGKRKQSTYKKDDESTLTRYASDTFGDGMDLYFTAFLSLWNTLASGHKWTEVFTDTVTANRYGGERKKDRTYFQKAFAEVRKHIDSYHAKDSDGKTLYIEDYCEDGEVILKRLPRYHDLGSFITSGGLDGVYTADNDTAEKTAFLLDAMKLSTQQSLIAHKRLQGLSYDKIADSLGVDKSTIRRQLDRIQAKAVIAFGGDIVFTRGKWQVAI